MSVSYGRLIRIVHLPLFVWVLLIKHEVLIVNKASQEERFMLHCSFEQKHGHTDGW